MPALMEMGAAKSAKKDCNSSRGTCNYKRQPPVSPFFKGDLKNPP